MFQLAADWDWELGNTMPVNDRGYGTGVNAMFAAGQSASIGYFQPRLKCGWLFYLWMNPGTSVLLNGPNLAT
jgi:hypothetical protein